MYTQCPDCQTIFAVTGEQLKARAGLVRCGKCAAVFHADYYLFDTLPQEAPGTEPTAEPRATRAEPGPESQDDSASIPTVTAFTPPRPRRKPHTGWWATGSVVLAVALAAQLAFYFRSELALFAPPLEPWLHEACAMIGCEIRPLRDPTQIELLEVEVAPHPKFDRALTFSATLVNRAAFVQPFPLLELSLTDSRGTPLARRTFTPEEYLAAPDHEAQGMAPNVAAFARLELTQPDPAAIGYEVQLVSGS